MNAILPIGLYRKRQQKRTWLSMNDCNLLDLCVNAKAILDCTWSRIWQLSHLTHKHNLVANTSLILLASNSVIMSNCVFIDACIYICSMMMAIGVNVRYIMPVQWFPYMILYCLFFFRVLDNHTHTHTQNDCRQCCLNASYCRVTIYASRGDSLVLLYDRSLYYLFTNIQSQLLLIWFVCACVFKNNSQTGPI